MRVHAGMSQEEVLRALTREALEAWGPERERDLEKALVQVARAMWMVHQVQLSHLSEEPDIVCAQRPPAREV